MRFNVNFYSSFLNALSDFYESKIKDLLNTKKDDLPIRQDQQQNIIIPNLTEVQYYLDFSVNDDIEYQVNNYLLELISETSGISGGIHDFV